MSLLPLLTITVDDHADLHGALVLSNGDELRFVARVAGGGGPGYVINHPADLQDDEYRAIMSLLYVVAATQEVLTP